MFAVSFLSLLLIVWAAVTLALVAVMIWRSLAGMKEEDVVVLDPIEDKQAAEQQQIIAKVERLTSWAKGLGFTSLALLLVAGGIWLYQGIVAFNTGRTQ